MDRFSYHQTKKKKSPKDKPKKRSPARKQNVANNAIGLENFKISRGNKQLPAIGLSGAVLAHEMTTQLNAMSCAAQLLEQNLADPKRVRDGAALVLVSHIRKELEQLGGSVRDLRALGQPPRLRLESKDLVTLVRSVVGSLQSQYKLLGTHVRLDVAGKLPAVAIDPHTLKPHGACQGAAVGCQVVSAHGGPLTYAGRNGNGSPFRIILPMEEQAKKMVHITWKQAHQTEAGRAKVRQARCRPIPVVPSLMEAITAHLSGEIPKLKATALRLWNAKNKLPEKLQRQPKESLTKRREAFPTTGQGSEPDFALF